MSYYKTPWKDVTDVFGVAMIASLFITAIASITHVPWIAMLCGFIGGTVIGPLVYITSLKRYAWRDHGYSKLRFSLDLMLCTAVVSFLAGWLALLT